VQLFFERAALRDRLFASDRKTGKKVKRGIELHERRRFPNFFGQMRQLVAGDIQVLEGLQLE